MIEGSALFNFAICQGVGVGQGEDGGGEDSNIEYYFLRLAKIFCETTNLNKPITCGYFASLLQI